MTPAAFFDIDGTLIAGLTQQLLAREMFSKGIINLGEYFALFWWFFVYKLGFIQNSECVRRRNYYHFRKLSPDELSNLFSRVYEKRCKALLRNSLKPIVASYKSKGYVLFAISGSIHELCEPICREFGIDHIYATRLVRENGFCTGEWEGVIYEGDRKGQLVLDLAHKFGLDLSRSAAFGDSLADVSMLQKVRYANVVEPDLKLKEIARKMNWTIFHE